MPNIKDFTDALTALTAPVAGDLIYVRNAAGNRKMTVQNLLNGVNSLAIIKGRDGGDIGGYLMDGVDDYITVPDDANLDFGLSDFSIELFVRLADYTPAAELILLEKHASNLGYKLLLTTAGKLKLQFGNGTNFTTFSYESDATGATDDSWAHFLVTADRDGNALFYVNGILNKTVDISGSVAQTLDNSGALNVFGNGSSYTAGRVAIVRNYTRILTSAEILSIFNNGRPDLYELDYAIKFTNNTSKITNGDFTTDLTGWTNDVTYSWATAEVVSNQLHLANVAGGAGYRALWQSIGNLIKGKQYRIKYSGIRTSGDIAVLVEDGRLGNNRGYSANHSANMTIDTIFTATSSGASVITVFTTNAADVDWLFDTLSLVPLGNNFELLPHNAGRLGWIESSGNQLSGSTSGSPICINTESNRPAHYRDIRKTIAANTNTTLTGIVPKGYKIVSIRAKGSNSLVDIKIGSASAGEQIVAATTTSSTTPKLLTLASTANDAYSESADVTLYARHDTSASGKTMDLIFHMEKVGN